VVDYAENSCRLIRTFGTGKTEAKLAFESDAPDEMDMMVLGRPFETFAERVAARFLPVTGKPLDGKVARSVTNSDPAILWSNVSLLPDDLVDKLNKEQEDRARNSGVRPPPRDLAEEAGYRAERQKFAAAASELAIQTSRDRLVLLETGSLGEPIKAFDKCSRDSLADWGVDPNLEDKIVRPVWAVNWKEWLTGRDYPRELAIRGEESTVKVRLLIDATGKVTNCTSLSHYDEKEFNRITCENIVKRGRFEPAELADGTKVPSYYVRTIVFRLAR
jgi:TonB family protein